MRIALITKLHEEAAFSIKGLSNDVITILTGLTKRDDIEAFKSAWSNHHTKTKAKDWMKSFNSFTGSRISKISPQEARALAG